MFAADTGLGRQCLRYMVCPFWQLEDLVRLEGKTAIITGGGSGFGAEIARRLAREGARLAVVDIDFHSAESVATETHSTAYKCDVSKSDEMAEFADSFQHKFGVPDILVNNAGITHLPTPLENVPEEEFDHVFAVNCKSVFLAARYFVPGMRSKRRGSILNVASTAAVSPRPRLSWYNSTKGWMITATKSMAIELAPDGIRVNALAPVAGDTPLLKRFLGDDTPETREKFLSTIPLGRFSTPEDLANAACFLCSDEASMITGAVLPVDGGRTI